MYRSCSQKTIQKTVLLLITAALLLLLPAVLPDAHAAHAKVRLSRESADMVPGYRLQLKVKGTTLPVTWKSGKRRIATVDENGIVTGQNPGTCRIFARVAGKKLACRIHVYDPGDVINTEGAMHGIDVSIWQGTINYKKVKRDGIDFVIMRAGYATDVDTKFQQNYTKAKAAGLKVGCYWFVTALTQSQLKQQIKRCKKAIRGKTFDMPVFIDIESHSQFRKGKAFCSSLVSGFGDKMIKAGYATGWYTSRSFIPKYLKNRVSRNPQYVAWVAEHGSTLHYSYPYDIWQYSHTGKVSGISGYVDLNWYFPNAGK